MTAVRGNKTGMMGTRQVKYVYCQADAHLARMTHIDHAPRRQHNPMTVLHMKLVQDAKPHFLAACCFISLGLEYGFHLTFNILRCIHKSLMPAMQIVSSQICAHCATKHQRI